MDNKRELRIQFLINQTARKIFELSSQVYEKKVEIKPLLETNGAFGVAFNYNNKKMIYLDESLVEGKIDQISEDFGYVMFHELLHHELRHFGRFGEKLKTNPTLANLVLDLFINNIVNKVFNSKIDEKVSTFENLLKDEIINNEEYEQLRYSSEDEIFAFFEKNQEIQQALQNLKEEIDNLFDNNQNNSSSGGSGGNNNNQNDNTQNNKNDGENGEEGENEFEKELNKFGKSLQKAIDNAINKSEGKGKKLLNKYGNSIANDYLKDKIQEMLGEEDDSSPAKETSARDVIKKIGEHLKKKGNELGDRLLEFVNEKTPITIHRILRVLEKVQGASKRKMIYPKKSVYQNTGVVLPRKREYGVKMHFIIDTSGSMNDDEINQMLKIARYLLSLGNELVVRFHSVESMEKKIRNTKEFEEVLRNPIVSGGSDFRNAFKIEDVGFFYSDLDIDYDLDKMPRSLIIIVPERHNKEVRKEFEKHFLVVDIDRIH